MHDELVVLEHFGGRVALPGRKAHFNQVVQRPREPVLTTTDVIEQLDSTDLGVVDQHYDRMLTRMRTMADSVRERAHR